MATHASTMNGRQTNNEWYATSGLPDVAPAGASAYAQRLARYISDPSTVRVRVLDEYGASPSIDTIRRWRKEWTDFVALRAAQRDPDDWDEERGLDPANDDTSTIDEICARIAARLVSVGVDAEDEVTPPATVIVAQPAPLLVPLQYPRTTREVIEFCAGISGVTAEEIISRSRKRTAVRARQFVAAVLRARGGSYPQVGRWTGGRDHSTAIHSVRVFFDLCMPDPKIAAAWMKVVPCALKMARTADELDMLMGVQG